ncbi:hypothetical protein CGRA01v4_04618 [Colletotrichum graminicola]|nr:hypothetical protein CGRA01v4_04618 [Colletotrichum graminicola]
MILDSTWTGGENMALVGNCTLQYTVGADLVAYHLLLPRVCLLAWSRMPNGRDTANDDRNEHIIRKLIGGNG